MHRNKAIFLGFFFLLFAYLRFADLTARPYHNDEGVNGNFTRGLLTTHKYKYDPKNYHGPLLYYAELPFAWANSLRIDGPAKFTFKSPSGITPWLLRATIAVLSLMVLIGVLFAFPSIGGLGSLIAFILLGFSCNFLFLSRYFIHEMYVILFSLGIYLALLWYEKTRKPLYIYVGVISAALLFCTKETSIFFFAVIALSGLFTRLTLKYLNAAPLTSKNKKSPFPYQHVGGAVLIAIALWVILFSSFFTNWPGLMDSFRAYRFWGAEGLKSGHEKPFFYFINNLLIKYEIPLVVLSFMGILSALVKKDRHGLFLSYWTLGIIGVYSLAPYKTPWCVINLILPMALLSGYAVQSWADWIASGDAPSSTRGVLNISALMLAGLIAIPLSQTLRIVYKEYDFDRYEMIYGHTSRDVFNLLNEIQEAGRLSNQGENIHVSVVSKEYWPIPFYLRNYPNAAFWGGTLNAMDAPIIIAEAKQRDEVDKKIRNSYDVKSYSIRPGYPVLMYIDRAYTTSSSTVRLPDFLAGQSSVGTLTPGLFKEIFSGIEFKGKPLRTMSGARDFDFWWDTDAQKDVPPPFSIRWSGWIKIPVESLYQFSLESDDGSQLMLDGHLIVDNGGEHATRRITQAIKLGAGYHRLELKYFDIGGGAVMRFTWAKPGESFEIVPKDVLFSAVK